MFSTPLGTTWYFICLLSQRLSKMHSYWVILKENIKAAKLPVQTDLLVWWNVYKTSCYAKWALWSTVCTSPPHFYVSTLQLCYSLWSQLTSILFGLSLLNLSSEVSELVNVVTSNKALNSVTPTWNNVCILPFASFAYCAFLQGFFLWCWTIPAGPAVLTHTSLSQSGHFTVVWASYLIFSNFSSFYHHC